MKLVHIFFNPLEVEGDIESYQISLLGKGTRKKGPTPRSLESWGGLVKGDREAGNVLCGFGLPAFSTAF